MLSVTEARHLLGADCSMTDEEVKSMLDTFRQIAFIALDTVDAERGRAHPPTRKMES